MGFPGFHEIIHEARNRSISPDTVLVYLDHPQWSWPWDEIIKKTLDRGPPRVSVANKGLGWDFQTLKQIL